MITIEQINPDYVLLLINGYTVSVNVNDAGIVVETYKQSAPTISLGEVAIDF